MHKVLKILLYLFADGLHAMRPWSYPKANIVTALYLRGRHNFDIIIGPLVGIAGTRSGGRIVDEIRCRGVAGQ